MPPEAGVDAAAVVEVFDPGATPGVDLVAGGEGAPVVVLGFEGGPKRIRPWRYPSTLRPAPSTLFLGRRACRLPVSRR